MILASELHDKLDLLLDEIQTGYFTDAEKDTFINLAQHTLMRRLTAPINPGGIASGASGFKGSGQMVQRYTEPFMEEVSGAISSGSVQITGIESQLSGSGKMWMVSSASVSDAASGTFYPSSWVSESEFRKRSSLKLFAGCLSSSMWFMADGSLVFSHGNYYNARVIRVPNDIELGVTDSEFPDAARDMIVYLAITHSGLALRDENFVEQVKKNMAEIGI